MLLKYAKPGYPNSKKGRKMKYEFELSQKKTNNNVSLKIKMVCITILTILKLH
jgi:hypothetical protein